MQSAKTLHNFEKLYNFEWKHVYKILKYSLYELGFSAKLTGYFNYMGPGVA
jgi:hypothetical protein